MRKSILILLLAPVALFGCSDDENVVVNKVSPEDLVIANSHAVQDAVEAFAAENNGEYPTNDSHRSLAGNNLIDLLPSGTRLQNPFTGEEAEPSSPHALYPGTIGYRPSMDWDSQGRPFAPGYFITGFGESTEIISLVRNYPDSILALEYELIAGCYIVQQAVEGFATENGEVYPADVDADTTALGNTVIDLLPGGVQLPNPFTLSLSEPTNGSAANRGEIGFLPVGLGGSNVGYMISSMGEYGTPVVWALCKTPSCDP